MPNSKHKYNSKWNTKKVNQLLEDIIEWHLTNPLKFTFFQYICDNRETFNYTREHIYYLIDKHGDAETEKLMSYIKQIQEEKLVANSLDNEWAPQIAKFILNCNYNYIPRQQQEVKVNDGNISFDFGNNDNDINKDE